MAVLPQPVSAEYRGRMRSHSMDGMLEEANRLLNLGDLDHAERLLREILLHDARMAPALTLSGVIAYLRGSSEAAIELMNRALAINPDNPVAYVTCGQAYRALGNLPAAEQSLRHALRLEPGRHDAHLNLALTLWSAGEHARAGTYFKNALLMGKKSFQVYFYLGQIHQENGELSAAEECFRNALVLQPKHGEARLLLGSLLLSQGRIPEASEEFEQAVSDSPGESSLRMAAARAAFELGDENRSLAHLQVAFVKSDADTGVARAHADRGRLCQFDAWCQEQQAESVRVAREQRHKVLSATVVPSGNQGLDIPEPNTPDVFVAGLNKCSVLPGDHLLFSRGNAVCIAGVMTRPLRRPFTSPQIIHYSDDGRLLMKIPDRQLTVDIPCAYLGAAESFFDWTFECVTRIWAYQQRSVSKDVPLLVQAGLSRWQSELLGLLGYEDARLIRLAEDSVALCDELFVASLSAPLNFVAPFALEHLRRSLRKTIAAGLDTPRRIFLTRQEMPTRRLANYREIAPILDRHGFHAIPADSLLVRELLQMIQSAEIVVGMEGAAMANVFMAPAQARIAMVTADVVRAARYCGPSCTLGQEFTFLQGKPAFESNSRISECDVHLDPGMFEEYLSRL